MLRLAHAPIGNRALAPLRSRAQRARALVKNSLTGEGFILCAPERGRLPTDPKQCRRRRLLNNGVIRPQQHLTNEKAALQGGYF